MSGAYERAPSGPHEAVDSVGLKEEHTHNEHELVAASLGARLALSEALQAAPERAQEIDALRNRLDSLITDANETLRTLGAVAAIGDVLEKSSTETDKEPELPDAQALVGDPDKAEQLLEGVIAITERVPADPAHQAVAQEAKAVLAEIPREKHAGRKLVLTIAERVAKICLDLAGLGAVSHALDLIEDCARVFMENRRTAAA